MLPPSACTHSTWVPAPMAPDRYEMCQNCHQKRQKTDPRVVQMTHMIETQDSEAPHAATDKPIQASLFD
jgi:hypothetical protein